MPASTDSELGQSPDGLIIDIDRPPTPKRDLLAFAATLAVAATLIYSIIEVGYRDDPFESPAGATAEQIDDAPDDLEIGTGN